MDQSHTLSGRASVAHDDATAFHEARVGADRATAGKKAALTLVSDRLVFAKPNEGVPKDWDEAIAGLTRALDIDAQWIGDTPNSGLLERARRAVRAGSENSAPVFAPWRVIAPTSFQLGQANLAVPDAQWVSSYLFDFGPACSGPHTALDIVLMSPCPQTCVSEDPVVGPLPKLGVLGSMIRSASLEGRKNLAIVVRDAARATLAARLLAFDPSLNDNTMDVEFVSLEQAVVEIQRGGLEWDALIVMPEARGVLFAMLAQASRICGPWPMLWFDRDLRLVTCEALEGATTRNGLDATALMQSLALLAKRSSRQFPADRFFQSWAAVRDSGVVTPARRSSAPYVNEIAEAAFIDRAASSGAGSPRPLPVWKGVASEERPHGKTAQPVRLTLVS